jgi:hypothetical protein
MIMSLKLVQDTLLEKNFSELEGQTGISRQSFYNFLKNDSMRLSNFTELLSSLDIEIKYQKKINLNIVLESLCYFGAPIGIKPSKKLDLETTLSEAIRASRKDPLLETLIPFVIGKNHDDLDYTDLIKKCLCQDTERYLGYYLSMSFEFWKHKGILTQIHRLSEIIEISGSDWISLLKEPPQAKYRANYEQNSCAKHWKIWTKGDLISHIQRWEKWNSLNVKKIRKNHRKKTRKEIF